MYDPDAKTLVATSQEQVDQLAEAMRAMSPPRVPEESEGSPEPLEFNGFAVPDGDYKVLAILRPQKGESGEVTEPLQIIFGCQESDWVGWVKSALRAGLTNGTVLAKDGATVLSGFTVMARMPNTEEKRQLALIFSQVVSLLPFKEFDEKEQVKRQRAAEIWKDTQEKRKAEKRKARLRARNNRRSK